MANHLDAASASFETGVGVWQAWYGCTIAQSTEQAYAGSNSLKITSTDVTGSAGVTFSNFPGTVASPGPGEKTIRFRVRRAGVANPAGNFTVLWRNEAGTNLQSNALALPTLDDTWQLRSAVVIAPTGTTRVYVEFAMTGLTSTMAIYIDDVYLGDDETAPPGPYQLQSQGKMEAR